MKITEYIAEIQPLSIHARFALGLRVFERYVSLRGLQDDSLWTYLAEMWEFPLIHDIEDKLTWEKTRCDLADYGLGDELPEELEEELASLAISEDYFELWVTHVTELAWGNMLNNSKGDREDESLTHLTQVLRLAAKSEVGVPESATFSNSLYVHNQGWGELLIKEDLEKWQASRCSINLVPDGELDCAEAVAFFD